MRFRTSGMLRWSLRAGLAAVPVALLCADGAFAIRTSDGTRGDAGHSGEASSLKSRFPVQKLLTLGLHPGVRTSGTAFAGREPSPPAGIGERRMVAGVGPLHVAAWGGQSGGDATDGGEGGNNHGEDTEGERWFRAFGPADSDFGRWSGWDSIQVLNDDVGQGPYEIMVPSSISARLRKVMVWRVEGVHPDDDIFETGLDGPSGLPVYLKFTDPLFDASEREFLAARRLSAMRSLGMCNTGCIVEYLETYKDNDGTIFLYESLPPTTLAQRLNVWLTRGAFRRMVTRLDTSLPILIGILRSCMDLEQAGLILAGLSTKCILYERGQILIAGLESACMLNDAEPGLSCRGAADSKYWGIGDPLFQPPEVVDGTPTGPKNHVFAAGLIFIALCDGINPMEKKLPAFEMFDEGRDGVSWRSWRERSWDKFFASNDALIDSLDPDIRRLLKGMTARDPDDRLSTEEALAEALRIAEARGIVQHTPHSSDVDASDYQASQDMLRAGTIGVDAGLWPETDDSWE